MMHSGRVDGTDKGAYLPTPEEIVEKCAEIRATWSDARRKSATPDVPPVEIHEVMDPLTGRRYAWMAVDRIGLLEDRCEERTEP